MSRLEIEKHVVGLVPAAGSARRLPTLPCSKEVFPLECHPPRVVHESIRVPMAYVLRGFRDAGINQALVGIRKEKWDIPGFFGDGSNEHVHLAYVPLVESASVTETVCRLLPMAGERICALGFPDILFSPSNAFKKLLARLRESGSEAVLGLFPTDRPEKSDMVAVDADGSVTDILIKRPDKGLRNTWSLVVWTPAFSERIMQRQRSMNVDDGELHLGKVLLTELYRGIRISSVQFAEGRALDIGTPDDLARAADFPPPGQ